MFKFNNIIKRCVQIGKVIFFLIISSINKPIACLLEDSRILSELKPFLFLWICLRYIWSLSSGAEILCIEVVIICDSHFCIFAGPVELASAGVSISIFNIVSKLFNIPLLSIATSFVAEDISRNAHSRSNSGKPNWIYIVRCTISVFWYLVLSVF